MKVVEFRGMSVCLLLGALKMLIFLEIRRRQPVADEVCGNWQREERRERDKVERRGENMQS